MRTYVAVGLDDGFTGSHQQRVDLDILSTEQTDGSAGTCSPHHTPHMNKHGRHVSERYTEWRRHHLGPECVQEWEWEVEEQATH